MIKFLFDLPRWAFFVLLILTPWAWGGIPTFVEILWYKIALTIVSAYVLGGLIQKRLSAPPVVPTFAAAWILAQGWWMVYNGYYQPNAQFRVILGLHPAYPGLPGSFDRVKSLLLMGKVTALLSIAYLVFDLSQSKLWRKRLLIAMLGGGGSIAAFGLIMRIQSPYGIWPDIDRNNYPFATFYYHGNAAAYLNTVLPVSMAMFFRSLFTDVAPITMAFVMCVFLVLGSAAFVCASKAGMVVAIVVIILLMLFFYTLFRGRFSDMTFELPPFFLWIVVVSIVVTLIICIGQQSIMNRWNYVREAGNGVMAGRQLTAQICYRTIPEAGWFGFGPGTFATVFPFAVKSQNVTVAGRWLDAHEDYLQTIIEWGKAGAIAWSLIFFGAVGRVLFSHRFWYSARRYDRVLLIGLMLSILGCAAHALVDFPLQITAIQLNVMVVAALLWSSPRWEMKSKVRRHSTNRGAEEQIPNSQG